MFVVGLAFLGLGLALSVLPGPFTIPPVLVGLLVWSTEFAFAERWLDKARDSAREAWRSAKEHPVRTGLVTGGGIVLVVVAAVLASRYGVVQHVKDAVT